MKKIILTTGIMAATIIGFTPEYPGLSLKAGLAEAIELYNPNDKVIEIPSKNKSASVSAKFNFSKQWVTSTAIGYGDSDSGACTAAGIIAQTHLLASIDSIQLERKTEVKGSVEGIDTIISYLKGHLKNSRRVKKDCKCSPGSWRDKGWIRPCRAEVTMVAPMSRNAEARLNKALSGEPSN